MGLQWFLGLGHIRFFGLSRLQGGAPVNPSCSETSRLSWDLGGSEAGSIPQVASELFL